MSLYRNKLSLLAKISRRHAVVSVPITIGPLRFDLLKVEDPDAVLDQVAERGGTAMPYWAELWDSSLGLGYYLLAHYTGPGAQILEKKKVLDLGCGIGLEGSVAARLGAEVLMADIESDALLFARYNCLFPGAKVRVRKVNWQRDDLREKFDIILGADIVYERGQWEYLERFWRPHLREGGMILLGEPGRQTGAEFVSWIAARNWDVQISQVEAGKRISILQLRLKSK